MTTNIYVILGGLFGIDGYADSAGMVALAGRLRVQFPDAKVLTYSWDRWASVVTWVQAQPRTYKTVLIGFSGGGSRAVYIANSCNRTIDLMVLYDPSPSWQMNAVGENVKRAIVYHNNRPLMFGLGGGVLVAPKSTKLTTIEIAEQHMYVQADETLHLRTIQAIKELQ